MKVILLAGPSNSGKTTTLHKLYEELGEKGGIDIEAPKPHPFNENWDKIYYVKYDDKKIGIVTLGDYSNEIVFQIGYFLGKGADILVIADSNKLYSGAICDWHGEKYDRLLEKVVVEKYSIEDMGKVQEIINKI